MYCLFCDVFCIVFVYMCTELLPPGGYPIAVNKYIISYQMMATSYKTILSHIREGSNLQMNSRDVWFLTLSENA